ncbi:hypothetical protein SEA_BIANCATRI92_73 [Mycobacterium phage BiancaTri92]|nr:hypothetical protein SEA_BIANCATRI92_73 [Mycobacterium phage BiancaTri92]
MALTRIASLFPEVVHTPVETIANEPGWIYAQKCEAWWKGQEHLDPTTILLVYRSPLVKDTGKMFRPISKLILAANRFEVIGSGIREDEHWMGEHGKFLVARMTQASELPVGPLDMAQVYKTISIAADEILGQVMASV